MNEYRRPVPFNIHQVRQRRFFSLTPFITISSFFLIACSADLVVKAVDSPTQFNGIRVYTPANFVVTKEIHTEKCRSRITQDIVQLPLGDPYDVTVKTSWFAKSEFTVLFNDVGLLKQVTINSTPQLAENLAALAGLAKAVGEATKPGPKFAEADCGAIVSEIITKVERFKPSPVANELPKRTP